MHETTPTIREAAAAPAGSPQPQANALPVGHRLHEFEIRGVIGVGGFGIVYRAFDHSLERDVAIKEYMPSALAGRTSKQQVSLLSAAHSETFALGLSSFVNEAKLLARFDHPSLVKVHRFWEDNGTAYMVMPLYRGITLRALRQQSDRCPDGAWLTQLLEQLLGALEVLHREGVYHRDIAPDNILVADGAPPVLLDFGAARRVISDRSQTLTAILKPSYAPLEQYAESTGMRQGPWTDFYALGATLHFMITGKPPQPATARALSDDQPHLAGSGQGGVPDLLLQVCDWMLAPKPHDRPQNAAEVRAALHAHWPVPRLERAGTLESWQSTVVQMEDGEAGGSTFAPSQLPVPEVSTRRRERSRTLWTVAFAMVLSAALGAWWATQRKPSAVEPKTPVASVNAVAPAAAAQPSVPDAARTNPAQGATPTAAPTAATRATAPTTPRVHAAAARDANSGKSAAPVVVPTATGSDATAAPSADHAIAAAPAAVPPAAAPRSPRDQCGGRHLVALHRCMVRECQKPEYTAHRDCQRVRDIEASARNLSAN